MKTTHIILILIVIVIVAVVVSTFSDSSTYADFGQAAKHPGREYRVIGTLSKDKEIRYDPKTNANLLTFYLIDGKGAERKVEYHNSKPRDFERSEKVVVVGQMKGDVFVASEMLLKCPSKYNDNKTPEAFGEKRFSDR